MAWVFNNSGITIWITSAFICFNMAFLCQNHRAGLTLRWCQFDGLLSSEYSMVTQWFCIRSQVFHQLCSPSDGRQFSRIQSTGRVPVAYSFLSRWWRNQTSCPDHQRLCSFFCFVAQPLIDIAAIVREWLGNILAGNWPQTCISDLYIQFSWLLLWKFLNIKIGFLISHFSCQYYPSGSNSGFHATLEEGSKAESDPPMRQKSWSVILSGCPSRNWT